MKKLFALFLLSIQLFNLSGYLIARFLISQNDRHLVYQLDKNRYADKDLVLIKIPLSLPYTTDNSSYTRVNGQVEFKGTYYNYVKRKISRDTLMLLCIPNAEKKRLLLSATQLGNVSEAVTSGKSHQPELKRSKTLDDYIFSIQGAVAGISSGVNDAHFPCSILLPASPQLGTAAKPPQA